MLLSFLLNIQAGTQEALTDTLAHAEAELAEPTLSFWSLALKGGFVMIPWPFCRLWPFTFS